MQISITKHVKLPHYCHLLFRLWRQWRHRYAEHLKQWLRATAVSTNLHHVASQRTPGYLQQLCAIQQPEDVVNLVETAGHSRNITKMCTCKRKAWEGNLAQSVSEHPV